VCSITLNKLNVILGTRIEWSDETINDPKDRLLFNFDMDNNMDSFIHFEYCEYIANSGKASIKDGLLKIDSYPFDKTAPFGPMVDHAKWVVFRDETFVVDPSSALTCSMEAKSITKTAI
jgi:hypothetical protein